MNDQRVQTSTEDEVKNYFKNLKPGWWNPKDIYPFIDMLRFKGKYVLDVGAGGR